MILFAEVILFIFACEFLFICVLIGSYLLDKYRDYQFAKVTVKQCEHRDDYGLHYATEVHSQFNCPKCGEKL